MKNYILKKKPNLMIWLFYNMFDTINTPKGCFQIPLTHILVVEI